jgi:hypothetical protein
MDTFDDDDDDEQQQQQQQQAFIYIVKVVDYSLFIFVIFCSIDRI